MFRTLSSLSLNVEWVIRDTNSKETKVRIFLFPWMRSRLSVMYFSMVTFFLSELIGYYHSGTTEPCDSRTVCRGKQDIINQINGRMPGSVWMNHLPHSCQHNIPPLRMGLQGVHKFCRWLYCLRRKWFVRCHISHIVFHSQSQHLYTDTRVFYGRYLIPWVLVSYTLWLLKLSLVAL